MQDSASLNKLIAANSLSPLMSNAKWVKLLALLVENVELIKECRVKLLYEKGAAERQLVFDEHTSYNFDYYDTAMEAMISGKPRGWYTYKEIEWLEFPCAGNGQTLEVLQQKIAAVGQFQLELLSDSLRLYAYRQLSE